MKKCNYATSTRTQHLIFFLYLLCGVFWFGVQNLSITKAAQAQNIPRFPRPQDNLPPLLPNPQIPPPTPERPELLPNLEPSPSPEPSPTSPGSVPTTVVVKEFQVVGSTVFSSEELNQITEPFRNRPLTISELYQVRSAINQLYQEQGYITSGAFIPPQELEDGKVTIQVIEGELEEIRITGLRRLQPIYIRSRLALGTQKPLNIDKLLEALQLLQINPLIESISADLSAGSQTGRNILEVKVNEADSFDFYISSDNAQVPSVGSVQLETGFEARNVTGFGDRLAFAYTNTLGSNRYNINYTLPVNPRNGTISFTYDNLASRIVEEPFDALDIESKAGSYEVSLRQPIIQSPRQELALGLNLSYEESNTSILGIPFPLSPGASAEGKTKISAVRFFQEWFTRSERDVFALRSQFSFGVEALGATINDRSPDSNFFLWRGQGQWLKQLAPDTLIIVRSDLQLADRPLLPLEQFTLGGLESVRGYRQDLIISDNGFFASAEVRVPVLRVPEWEGLLQVAPFVDVGTAWDADGRDFDPSTLVSVGLGLYWQLGRYFNARLVWGIPLIDSEIEKKTNWQENGLYFSLYWKVF
jgi:hemolysin activation/secretion protein